MARISGEHRNPIWLLRCREEAALWRPLRLSRVTTSPLRPPLERDGVIEKVEMMDIDGNASKELIIAVRCVGSGAYLSGFALTLRNEVVQILAQDSGMLKDANVALELGRIARTKK